MFGLFLSIFTIYIAYYIYDISYNYSFPKRILIDHYVDTVYHKFSTHLDNMTDYIIINDNVKYMIPSVFNITLTLSAFIDFDEFVQNSELFNYAPLSKAMELYKNDQYHNETIEMFNKYNIPLNTHRNFYFDILNNLTYTFFNKDILTDMFIASNEIFLKEFFELSEIYFTYTSIVLNDFNVSSSQNFNKDVIDHINTIVSQYEDFQYKLNNINFEKLMITYGNMLQNLDQKYNHRIFMQPTPAPKK